MYAPVRRLVASAALLGALLLAGCASTGYVRAEVPAGIEAYPSTYYDGHVVYWVGDRWYAHRNGVWVYYRSEPPHLYRYRARWHGPYYRPPARYYQRPHPHHYRPHRHAAPPARRAAPPARRAAPPARRAAPPARDRR